ncbi:MAG: DUF4097 family beta strand repeat protein [Lachnospiraceae bacterium]|jgi:hypothetical protein|nr:DUF4097 family beta strand repeat protein [Lachnospiraceae bacterium]
MTKLEYMKKLQEKLEKFGKELQEEILEDYRQHFAEGENEGKSEEEIIDELGNIEEMIRELSEEDLPEGFAQLDPGGRAENAGQVTETGEEEEEQDVKDTDLKKSFSYSAYYKGIVLEGKAANVFVSRSEDNRIHVDYEVKGVSNQLNYEYYQHEEDGVFYAGVKRRKGARDEGDSEEKMVKVTLFGHTIISYGNISNFSGGGQNITLTVRIPKGVPKLTVKVGSGNVSVSGVELEAFEGSSGSGNVALDEVVADRLKAHSGSGNIKVSHTEFISGSLDTGSGNVKAEMIKGRDLKCGTGSGNVKVDAAVAEYHLSTGSGSIKLRAVGASELADMSTGSGSIKLELEGAKGMEAAVRSGSGSIYIDWDGQESQKVKNGTYAYGNSACKVKASSGSGSIKISGN